MSIYIEWIFGPENTGYNKIIEEAIKSSLDFEEIKVPVEVSVMIVNDEEIQGINLEQRGKDSATDVLSFPMVDYDFDDTIEAAIEAQPSHPETNERYLGDVVISWEKVIEQSDDYGHSLNRELGFLVVHSMLHLLGYDHMVEDEEKVMVLKQKGILEKMRLSR